MRKMQRIERVNVLSGGRSQNGRRPSAGEPLERSCVYGNSISSTESRPLSHRSGKLHATKPSRGAKDASAGPLPSPGTLVSNSSWASTSLHHSAGQSFLPVVSSRVAQR
jgi:hypothetical protein